MQGAGKIITQHLNYMFFDELPLLRRSKAADPGSGYHNQGRWLGLALQHLGQRRYLRDDRRRIPDQGIRRAAWQHVEFETEVIALTDGPDPVIERQAQRMIGRCLR